MLEIALHNAKRMNPTCEERKIEDFVLSVDPLFFRAIIRAPFDEQLLPDDAEETYSR